MSANTLDASLAKHVREKYADYTYDMFMMNMSAELEEMQLFSEYVDVLNEKKIYTFEAARGGTQGPENDLDRFNGEKVHVVNLSSYNYLGFSYHPDVIKAAQDAVAKYGLGASSSPVISGTYTVHKQLEEALVKFFGLPGRGVSLFTAGYSVNLGAISAFIKPGHHVIMDSASHMSIVEGAKLSGGETSFFRHNDMAHLEELLKEKCDEFTRVLICVEGIYSGDGDYGNIKDVVRLAKKYGAFTLVDEAHSALVSGKHGRGVCEQQGVLEEVDLYVMTFSKAFGGVGGAVYAKKEITQYMNWYAKCRMFSCALDPAVTGGMAKVIELAGGPLGNERRERIKENATYYRGLLEDKVHVTPGDAWVVIVHFGSESKTLALNDYLQREGLDTSIIQFPAVPRNEARIRMFITSEHTKEQLKKAADIIVSAAQKFDFLKK
ncbi:MAG: aminotransferase class I/II-fold pyridoxal phosphate-dependent enzyme [Bacteroidetes bacterium]|nr:aminotransferase class I/II-fold pyridoxal phosphate-dependent enzyme [Bacteroidota bacterium]